MCCVAMTTQTTTSSYDSSTIQTVDELSQEVATSVLLEDEDSSIITSASKEGASHRRYSSDLWETATDTSTSSRQSAQELTETNHSTDRDEWRKGRGGARRESGEGSPHETGGSYYTADWESNQSSDSCAEEPMLSKASVTQRRFVRNKLCLLKKSGHKAGSTATQAPEATRPEAEERSLFCQKVIQMVQHKNRQGGASTKAQTGGIGEKSRSSSNDHSGILINREVIDRLKIENLLSTMKKAASIATTSGTDSCQHCQESQTAALRRDFIRHRTSRLGNELTERRLDWLLSTQDPLTAVGDLARELPKPTDDPQELWDRMMDHGIT
ncbi:uncharacterized protein C8orf48 homolog [Patiria miniata]|uniref:Uncharacterized protein n=1 Tax=Patiria miniata TaxID=46514 RepID=A0A913ZWQ9_PATMI|nr:uncharacterized protein C8orf48 homolog [Patiria miniata]XP_038055737.1 uncharacterized protein C8orf48 homolog [Patiria miniata]XP_038055739.1 uncharacterized protein C8orf48 homolog [Patiria miniata]XP_038055740.1 uncharacterized protein C8orf48 homolog [Patiria miniata]